MDLDKRRMHNRMKLKKRRMHESHDFRKGRMRKSHSSRKERKNMNNMTWEKKEESMDSMESKQKEISYAVLFQMRTDIAQEQKRGIHIISASVVIWTLILAIHASPLPILQRNLLTFCCSCPLLPLAYLISRRLGIDFEGKSNPLTGLGLLFSLNQILYILIAMWIYAAVPEKMLMVYAMIFGAHLLPYGWLYRSKTYYTFSLTATVIAFLLGLNCPPAAVAAFMLVNEIVFSCCLIAENKIH